MRSFILRIINMMIILWCGIIVFFVDYSSAAIMSKQDFENAVKGSSSSDDGYYGIKTGDKVEFTKYICENWKSLLENYKPNYNNSDPNNRTLTINLICYAAEDLPPMEYLDFLDELLGLLETRNFGFDDASNLFHGRNSKDAFLAVNWEHPRVQSILRRQMKMFQKNPATIAALEATASGELADNYRTNVSDDAPNPQTLPGIKLLPPGGTLLRKIQRAIPGFSSGPRLSTVSREEREGRRAHSSGLGPAVEGAGSNMWLWFGISAVVVGLSLGILKCRSKLRWGR